MMGDIMRALFVLNPKLCHEDYFKLLKSFTGSRTQVAETVESAKAAATSTPAASQAIATASAVGAAPTAASVIKLLSAPTSCRPNLDLIDARHFRGC